MLTHFRLGENHSKGWAEVGLIQASVQSLTGHRSGIHARFNHQSTRNVRTSNYAPTFTLNAAKEPPLLPLGPSSSFFRAGFCLFL